MRKKGFRKSSCIFRIVILITLFLFNFFNAQQKPLSDKQSAKIVLAQGAQLFSSDESFNKQVAQKEISIENADLSFKNVAGTKVLIASASPRDKNQNLTQQVRLSEEKKRKEAVKQIKEKIDQYKAESKSFQKHYYQDSPSPSQFFSSHSSSKNYVAPSYNINYFSKIYASDKDYSVKRALDFLHTQQFTYHNNKSLDFCFSEVFSVRPPPVVLS